MRARGGALSGPFGSPERVLRPRVPVRDHPGLTALGCGRPRDGALASRLTETRPVPDGLGCGPPSRALGRGHGPPDGRASGPQPASRGRRARPAPARGKPRRAGGAGGRGVSVGGPREAVQSRGCQRAPAPREPGVCTRRNWGTTFSRCYEFCYPGKEGLEFICLRRGQEEGEEPLGHKLPFTSPLPPPFSFLRSPLN